MNSDFSDLLSFFNQHRVRHLIAVKKVADRSQDKVDLKGLQRELKARQKRDPKL